MLAPEDTNITITIFLIIIIIIQIIQIIIDGGAMVRVPCYRAA